jgi:hypothetical protein
VKRSLSGSVPGRFEGRTAVLQPIDWNKFSFTKIRVLRGLADYRSEREIAGDLGVEYTTVRGL